MDSRDLRTRAEALAATLRAAGHEAWFVGGCVRDLLRGVEPDDYDIVTSARPPEIAELFERTIGVGAAFGVVVVLQGDAQFEVATFRAEGAYEDGRHPSRVEFADAERDVRRRDFTINGLLMDPATGEVVDLVGGRDDLARRVVRTIGDADGRFREDHLRMLRAVRFAANLSFSVEPATLDSIRRNAGAIALISAERVRDELNKLLTRGGARTGFDLMLRTGLLERVLPEVAAMRGVAQPPRFHPEGDVWEHTMRMLDLMGPRPEAEFAWGALLHDVGKPATRQEDAAGVRFYGHAHEGVEIAGRIMQRLKFPSAAAETVRALVREHMNFMPVREMRPNRLKRFLRMERFDLHLELHRLDCASSHGLTENYDFCRSTLVELAECELRPPPLVTGHDLIAMGFDPGPLFGEILTAVEDAQLDGEIEDADAARSMVLGRWGDRRARR
jgi:poly(A) polymerase